ncbi:MAG: AAA family ATPase, partial [Bradymonadaceae bacterium]
MLDEGDASADPETRPPEVGAFGRPSLYSELTPAADGEPACDVPTDWEVDQPWRPRPYLAGTSLGLYSLRRPPMIDREEERAKLWERLRHVAETGSPECVLLRGPSGTGKTRLATWLRERVEELGCGVGMQATHSRSHAKRDGLAAMVARHLHLSEAGPDEHLDVIECWFQRRGVRDPYAWRSIAKLLENGGFSTHDSANIPQLERFEQRAAALERFIRCATTAGPVVLHLDDLIWKRQSLEFAEYILDHVDDIALLIVGTARDESLTESDSRERVDRLADHHLTDTLEVPPLCLEDQRLLLSQLLDLEPDLQRRILRRTEGNPLFSVQLLNHCVEQGLLVADEDGFALADTQQLPVPDNLEDFWSNRVESLLEEYPDDASAAAEIAAALGGKFETTIWRACCDQAQISDPTRTLELFDQHGLTQSTDTGWSFAHPMIREALEQRARGRGQWCHWNRVCATVLSRRHDNASPDVSRRVAKHATEAEQPRLAVRNLLSAIAHASHTGDADSFLRVLEQLETIFPKADLGKQAPERTEYLIHRAQHLFASKEEPEAARNHLHEALNIAQTNGYLRLHAEALRGLGKLQRTEMAYEKAVHLFERGIDIAERTGECQLLLGGLHRDLGETLTRTGQTPTARTHLNKALQLCEDSPTAQAKIYREIALSWRYEDHPENAKKAAKSALGLWKDQLSLHGEARILNLLGDLERQTDNLDAAANYYDRACEITEVLGRKMLGFVFLSRAQVALELENFTAADCRLKRAGHEPQVQNVDYFQYLYRLFRVWSAVGLEDWETAHQR